MMAVAMYGLQVHAACFKLAYVTGGWLPHAISDPAHDSRAGSPLGAAFYHWKWETTSDHQ